MASYIDKNTQLKAKATNDFEKDFFKLMNNSVFGKTMENIRNRSNIQLVNEQKAVKLIAKTYYKCRTEFDENLIAVHMGLIKLKFDKPVYTGACILDISKTLMYDFHYNKIKKQYNKKAKLLFTNTDSLCYEIETKDVYKDMNKQSDLFDLSNYDKNHERYSTKNKKVIGKFKGECGGLIMNEFVGLRAKLYSYKMDNDETEIKKCKGITRAVIKKLTHENYKNTLFGEKDKRVNMNVIRSYKHEIYTETVYKIALSANDDKRIIRKDKISTYALKGLRSGNTSYTYMLSFDASKTI